MVRDVKTLVSGVALILLVVALTGCGGGSPSAKNTVATAASHGAAQRAAKAAAAKQHAASCRKAIGPLIAAESQLDGRLNVGIQFSDYTSRLGDISVAYNHAVAALKRVTIVPACINKVGLPLQRAFNDYTMAGHVWNTCIQSFSCTFDKGSPALKRAQAKWSMASVALESAKAGLGDIGSTR